MIVKNFFSRTGADSSEEIIEPLLTTGACTLERIVSTGQSTPPGMWYDQDTDEWVMLLSGSAGILFEQEEGVCTLYPGDYVFIPARARHRVEWTEPHATTIWLAIHLRPGVHRHRVS